MSKQFSTGQKVKVVQRAAGLTMGNVYTVTAPQSGDAHGFTYVTRDNGRRDGWRHDRFEAVNETPKISAYPFSAGDKVRCVKALGCARGYLKDNATYTVEAVDGDRTNVRLVGVANPYNGWDFSRFVRVTEPVFPFKAGDKVRYRGGSGWAFLDGKRGSIFTVHEIVESQYWPGRYFLRIVEGLEANPTHTQVLSQFERVEQPQPAPEPSREFRIRKHGKTGDIRGTPYASIEDAETAIARYMPGTVYEIVEVSVVRTVKIEQEIRVVDYKEAA